MNEINNEDILQIQNEIDNLEQKLFSNNNSNISLSEINSISESNNINSIHLSSKKISNNDDAHIKNKPTNEKLNEKSYKFNNINLNKINDKIKNDNIKIIENDDIDNQESINDKFKKEEKIKELIELQKEIDNLRQERSKKIKNKLNKMHNYNNSKIQKNKIKSSTIK